MIIVLRDDGVFWMDDELGLISLFSGDSSMLLWNFKEFMRPFKQLHSEGVSGKGWRIQWLFGWEHCENLWLFIHKLSFNCWKCAPVFNCLKFDWSSSQPNIIPRINSAGDASDAAHLGMSTKYLETIQIYCYVIDHNIYAHAAIGQIVIVVQALPLTLFSLI